MSYHGYDQPYGQPPPGYGQYPPQGGQYPPPQGQFPPPQHGQYPPQQQQGGYGAYPPPQQPGGYPQGGYYQQPPPQQGQWPPPSQNPYGQPPPGQYGAPPPPHPPPPQGSPYGGGGGGGGYAPPQVPPTPPSLGYGPPQMIQWDASADAQALRGAMKGFGTDESALIRVLATKDPLQIEVLRTTFDRTFGRKLIEDIKKETSRYFERGLVQLARGPLLADAHNLYEALTGVGTKEVVMNDVLLARSNADLRAIRGAYQHAFRRNLEDDVKHNLSMKTERHFLMVLAANRAEDAAPVIPQQVEDDVLNIYKATEGKEFSGHMEDALLYQLRHAEDKYMHAAKLLEDTMAGPGTKDYLLVNRIVRFHWNRNDMANIKGAYQQRYKRTLASRVKGEVSGDYERLMLACIGE